jgi:hypothetical protein
MTTAPRAAAPLGTGGVGVASAEVRVPGASEAAGAAGLRVAGTSVAPAGRRCEAAAGT